MIVLINLFINQSHLKNKIRKDDLKWVINKDNWYEKIGKRGDERR